MFFQGLLQTTSAYFYQPAVLRQRSSFTHSKSQSFGSK